LALKMAISGLPIALERGFMDTQRRKEKRKKILAKRGEGGNFPSPGFNKVKKERLA